MSENKNFDQMNNSSDLKHADSEKKSDNGSSVGLSDSLGAKMSDVISTGSSKVNARKKLPLVADIIIAVVMVLLIIGAVIGSYYLFRYYTNDYQSIELEYCIVTPYEKDIALYKGALNTDVYCDTNGNSFYLGKVKSVELSADQSLVVIVIECSAKYRSGEGYSVGDCKIAVGAEHLFRSRAVSFDGTIVEMHENGTSSKGGN